MTPKKLKERKDRLKRLDTELRKIFPKAKIALKHSNTWELLVAVILSAQCTDKRVDIVTEGLFKKYKKIEDYAKARSATFEKDIFQTGFYRNKARNIIGAAKMVLKEYDGKVPGTMDELINIPGVGRKTANVVLWSAFGASEGIAVDTHVRRLVIRFDLSDYKDAVRIEKDLMEVVPKTDWGIIDHMLIKYGREICPARKHDCTDHPLTKIYPKAANNWPKAR